MKIAFAALAILLLAESSFAACYARSGTRNDQAYCRALGNGRYGPERCQESGMCTYVPVLRCVAKSGTRNDQAYCTAWGSGRYGTERCEETNICVLIQD
ncbi:MAG: hypothetical protein EOP05_08625 [Proteobacteria bacterium]|nr:MAG: hypothetical protein EOP05_08625 [Pseudomonadota bacterium]